MNTFFVMFIVCLYGNCEHATVEVETEVPFTVYCERMSRYVPDMFLRTYPNMTSDTSSGVVCENEQGEILVWLGR